MQSAADWLFGTSVVPKFFHVSSVYPDNKQNKITRTTTTFIYRTSKFAVTITNHKDHVVCSGVTVIVMKHTDRETDRQCRKVRRKATSQPITERRASGQ